ncbi:hypothetical protein HK096_010333 [Nowakowskiella sp. JEL0078]|nr:hypothetical protein HK096_010333 [Nowakowskiella sp. JEL0078]
MSRPGRPNMPVIPTSPGSSRPPQRPSNVSQQQKSPPPNFSSFQQQISTDYPSEDDDSISSQTEPEDSKTRSGNTEPSFSLPIPSFPEIEQEENQKGGRKDQSDIYSQKSFSSEVSASKISNVTASQETPAFPDISNSSSEEEQNSYDSPEVQRLRATKKEFEQKIAQKNSDIEAMEKELNEIMQKYGLRTFPPVLSSHLNELDDISRDREKKISDHLSSIGSQLNKAKAEHDAVTRHMQDDENQIRIVEEDIFRFQKEIEKANVKLVDIVARLTIRNEQMKLMEFRKSRETTDRVFHERMGEQREFEINYRNPGHQKFMQAHQNLAVDRQNAENEAKDAEGENIRIKQEIQDLLQEKENLIAQQENLNSKIERFKGTVPMVINGTFAAIKQLMMDHMRLTQELNSIRFPPAGQ